MGSDDCTVSTASNYTQLFVESHSSCPGTLQPFIKDDKVK